MRINWDTPIDELYHGDNIVYVDLDADEIVHFKYIKREKLPNGKYRYYYDQSELEQYKTIADRANNAATQSYYKYQRARVNLDRAEADLSNDIDRVSPKARSRGKRGLKEDRQSKRVYDNYKTAKDEKYKAEKEYERAIERAVEKEKQYNKKKIISFPARTIAKGAVKVANFFSGANRKTKKKK